MMVATFVLLSSVIKYNVLCYFYNWHTSSRPPADGFSVSQPDPRLQNLREGIKIYKHPRCLGKINTQLANLSCCKVILGKVNS